MMQLYGDRADVPVASRSFTMIEKPKKFYNYCKKKNHIETDCWKKRKLISQNRQDKAVGGISGPLESTYISYLSDQEGEIHRSGLTDSGAVTQSSECQLWIRWWSFMISHELKNASLCR
jgi:hypothetical protein